MAQAGIYGELFEGVEGGANDTCGSCFVVFSNEVPDFPEVATGCGNKAVINHGADAT